MKCLYAAALIGLVATPASAQSNSDRYIAQGGNPVWSITIDSRTIRFERAGERTIVGNAPRAIKRATGDSWRSRRISLTGTNKHCVLQPGDRIYSQTVVAIVDGKSFRGCGERESLGNPRMAIDGDWNVVSINGTRVARDTAPSLRFRDGKITGNASCNRLSGTFSFKGGKLAASPLALTRMGCPNAQASAQERAIANLFADQLSLYADMDDTLTLVGPGSKSITLLRSGRR